MGSFSALGTTSCGLGNATQPLQRGDANRSGTQCGTSKVARPTGLTVDRAGEHAINLPYDHLRGPANVDPSRRAHAPRQITRTLAGQSSEAESDARSFLSQTHRMLSVPTVGKFVQGKTERAKDLQEVGGRNAHTSSIPVPKSQIRNIHHVSDMAQLRSCCPDAGGGYPQESSLRCGPGRI